MFKRRITFEQLALRLNKLFYVGMHCTTLEGAALSLNSLEFEQVHMLWISVIIFDQPALHLNESHDIWTTRIAFLTSHMMSHIMFGQVALHLNKLNYVCTTHLNGSYYVFNNLHYNYTSWIMLNEVDSIKMFHSHWQLWVSVIYNLWLLDQDLVGDKMPDHSKCSQRRIHLSK